MELAAQLAVGLGAFAAFVYAAGLAADTRRPLAQALARLVTLVPAYLHELAHASASILVTGRGRIRLHSVHEGSQRDDGQVALGSSDIWVRGPITNALVSAAPALLLWPAAAWLGWQGGTLAEAACAGMLAYAGRLSDSDLQHLRGSR